MRKVVIEVAMEIAYSAEVLGKISERYGASITMACAMSNSVGGIGPLLRERLPAQAEKGAEVIGVSLLYDSVWTQGFYQWGQIFIEKKKVGDSIRMFLEDSGISFDLEMPDGTTCKVKVWKTSLKTATVYLLDAPEIASVVYPGPEDAPKEHKDSHEWVENQKMLQSWLVGRGTLALLKILNKKPEVIVQSETPTFFANHFLVMDSYQKDHFFENTHYIFNDHTPLEYAHPFWDEAYTRKARIDPKFSRDEKYWNSERNGIDITRLLIGVSDETFGVSKKHRNVMLGMPSLKGLENKIDFITNGIDVSYWRHPNYTYFEKMSDEELISQKEARKAELIEWVWRRYKLWVNWRLKVKGKCFVNWTRRVTTYKRFDVLEQLLRNPDMRKRFLETDIVVLMGGRIHQNDNLSHNIMFTLLDLVTRDDELKDRVVVLDNYNIWTAHKIFQGVDATIMLSDDGKEASATGFMKAQVNGAIVIACSDGAIPESVVFEGSSSATADRVNGFEVPYVNGVPRPEELLIAFEKLNQVYHNAKGRADMIRASFRAETQVSVDHTANEMIKLYVKVCNKQ